jgi:hypothetical protein
MADDHHRLSVDASVSAAELRAPAK